MATKRSTVVKASVKVKNFSPERQKQILKVLADTISDHDKNTCLLCGHQEQLEYIICYSHFFGSEPIKEINE